MPSDVRQITDLIGNIYDCVLDEGRWEGALAGIGHALDACNVRVVRGNEDGLRLERHWGMLPEVVSAYHLTYGALDPMAPAWRDMAEGEPVTFQQIMPDAALHRTRFYQEFLRPGGRRGGAQVVIDKSPTEAAMLGFSRRDWTGPAGERELALLRQLAPHVRRATRLGGILAGVATRAGDLAALLNLLPVPVLLFDAAGACIETNAAADRLLASARALCLVRGAVRARDPALAARFAAALVAATGSDCRVAQAASLGWTDKEGRRFAAHLLPLGAATHLRSAGMRRAAAVMFVQQVGALAPLPGPALARLYGLTPAEFRLASQLGRGLSLEEAAAALGIAAPTVRSQLQRLFAKTGTARQAELVRRILSVLPAPAG